MKMDDRKDDKETKEVRIKAERFRAGKCADRDVFNLCALCVVVVIRLRHGTKLKHYGIASGFVA